MAAPYTQKRWSLKDLFPGHDSPEMKAAVRRIENGQTRERIKVLYEVLKDNPKIKWKSCLKHIIGLPMNNTPGLDI